MKNSTLFITSLSFLLVANLVGCRAEELGEVEAGSDQQSDALESAITVISGQADDATGAATDTAPDAAAPVIVAADTIIPTT